MKRHGLNHHEHCGLLPSLYHLSSTLYSFLPRSEVDGIIYFFSEFWMIFTILSTYVSFLKPNNTFDFYIFISDFQRKLLTCFVKSLNYLSFSNRSSKEMKFCSLGLFEQIQSRLLRLMTNPLGYNSTISPIKLYQQWLLQIYSCVI